VLRGKILFFVNSIDHAFYVKLFFDQFSIRSVVLNSELPVNSRVHCVEQFNAGLYDIMIATDEMSREDENPKSGKKDMHFGVSRGLDFRAVSAVINIDVPRDASAYTHRAGRTARAGNAGTVLTVVSSEAEESAVKEMCDEAAVPITPLALQLDQIEAFRYRVEDCLRGVTRDAIRDARLKDVEKEIINSEKLQEYFKENPEELDAITHDRKLAVRVQSHLAHIPSYLLPPALRHGVSADHVPGSFSTKFKGRSRRHAAYNARGATGGAGGSAGGGGRGADPLAAGGGVKKKRTTSGTFLTRQQKKALTKRKTGVARTKTRF